MNSVLFSNHRARSRVAWWLSVIFLLVSLPGPIGSAELSDEEKRKRAAFLKAREEMRTVATPTPETKKKKAKPKASKRSPKKKSTPKPKREEEEEAEDEATPRRKRATPEPTPEETPQPRRVETPETPPRKTPTPAPAQPQEPAQVVIEKSGYQKEEEVVPPPQQETHRFLFWKWTSTSKGNYSYLTRSVRNSIDRAPVLKRRWQFLVVHNSGTRQGNARIFDYYHKHVRKMQNGLAYHFVIGNGTSSGDGEIEVGSRWLRQINGGHVHSDYLNNIALGICLVGDFNRDQPTRRQLAACEELINYLRRRCGKAVNGRDMVVKPHRDINPPRWPTDCPGDDFPYGWFRRF